MGLIEDETKEKVDIDEDVLKSIFGDDDDDDEDEEEEPEEQ